MHRFLRLARHLVEGVAMGVANIIPGVSGGTIALVLGIYERLIGATGDAVRAVVAAVRLDFRRALTGLRDLPWAFLLPIAVGMIATPLLAAGWLEGQLERYPEAMRGIFFGLVLGSIGVPWVRQRRRQVSSWLVAVLAAVAAYVLVGLPPRTVVAPTYGHVFISASLAISAMVLPGVSGSFLLVVLGMYAPTLTALDTLDLRYLGVFAAGAAVGLALFAILLSWLLEHRHDVTMAALVGLMVGSLRALWPWQTAGTPRFPSSGEPVTSVVLWLAAALILSLALASVEIRRVRRDRTTGVDPISEPA